MKPRKPAPEQPDLLADITRLSRFPQHKNRQPGQFQGTENPRALRLLRALLKQPLTRESADTITGASNGPEEVRKLREQGLELPCYRLGGPRPGRILDPPGALRSESQGQAASGEGAT